MSRPPVALSHSRNAAPRTPHLAFHVPAPQRTVRSTPVPCSALPDPNSSLLSQWQELPPWQVRGAQLLLPSPSAGEGAEKGSATSAPGDDRRPLRASSPPSTRRRCPVQARVEVFVKPVAPALRSLAALHKWGTYVAGTASAAGPLGPATTFMVGPPQAGAGEDGGSDPRPVCRGRGGAAAWARPWWHACVSCALSNLELGGTAPRVVLGGAALPLSLSPRGGGTLAAHQ